MGAAAAARAREWGVAAQRGAWPSKSLTARPGNMHTHRTHKTVCASGFFNNTATVAAGTCDACEKGYYCTTTAARPR